MSEPYKFCYSCGGKLIVHTRIWSYDGETGEPNITYDYVCSNKRWNSFGHPLTSDDSYTEQVF